MRGYARTAAQEPLRYFHSTDAPLKPGDIIDPASVVGRSSGGNENDPWGWSNSWEGYDPNYVYMWDHRMTEKSPDPGGWHPFLEDEHVYEVEPMGEVVQDPEGAALKAKYDETGDENYEPEWYHPYSWAAPQARVVGEVGIDDPVFERARQMRDLQSLSQHSPPSPFTPLPLSDHPNAHPSHARIGTDTVNNGSPSSVNNETTRVPASISRHDERQSHLYHRNGNVTPNTLHGYSPDSANDTHASLASQRAGIKRSIPSDTHRDLWEDDPPYAEGPNKEAHFCAISESPSDIADQIGTSSLERLAWNPFKRQRPLRQNFNAQPWKPGENGKAFFWGGKPYLWSTQGYGPDGRPAHGDMALQLGDPAGITSSAWIDPEGNIKFPYETFEPSPAEEQEAIRQMVEEARGRLGSHKHALFGDGGPEHPDYDRIQHTPGMWGKGVLWPTGAVHTWQTDGEDGLPWHDHYADNNDYPNIKSRWKFEILPGSNKFSTYYPPEPQDQQLIEQKTGLEYTKDPYADWGEDAWNEHNSHKHAYDEFKPWVPGSWGKALTLEDGTPHLWRTEGPGDQFPLHGDYAFAKEIPRQEIAGEFVIHPNGDVMSTGLAKGHFEEVAKRTGGKPIDYMTGWDFNENDWDDDDFND